MRVGNLTRDFFRPRDKGALKWLPNNSKAEIWTFEFERANGRKGYGVMGFGGKRTKPDIHYNYPSRALRDKEAKAYAERQAFNEAYAAKQKAVKKNPHTLEVGDLMYTSWGYDQTNVDFFEVTELHGKTMVTVEAIGSRTVRTEAEWGANYVAPNPTIRSGAFTRHRAGADNTIKINSYSYAHTTFLNNEHYETDGMWGH